MKHTLVLIYLLLSTAFQTVNGKETSPYFFTQIGIEDGLTQGTVTRLYQDTDGYLWVGTQGGIYLYDGYEFKIFRNNPADSCSLIDNNILDIGEDRNKNIWVITYNGLHKIAHQTHTIKRYRANKTALFHCCLRTRNGDFLIAGENAIFQYDEKGDSLRLKDWLSSIQDFSGIKAFQEDKEGNLYVVSANKGMVVLNQQKKVAQHYRYNRKDPSSYIRGTVCGLFTDSKQRLWILSTSSGLCYLDKKQNKFVHLNTNNSDLSSNVVRAIAEPQPGTLLIGTFAGLNSLDMETLKISPHKFIPNEPGALGYYSIHSLLKDNTDALWVGTWKGLNYYSPARKQFYMITPNEFTGMLGMGKEDKDGNLWFATEGSGLFRYNPTTRDQQFYPIKSPNKNNYNDNIFKSLFIKGDSILCATNKGAVYLFSQKRKEYKLLFDYKSGDIYNLLIDSKERLWIPTNTNKGLLMIDNGKSTNQFKVNGKDRMFYYITTLKEIEPDVFIMGSLTENLYKYDLKKETLKVIFPADLNLHTDTKPGKITGMMTDSLRNIWVSFLGSGIYRFDYDMNLIKHYTETDGITDSYIYTIVNDRNNQLWALSEKTLYCYDPKTDRFTTIHNDSRQALEFSHMAATTDSNGTLYFPGNKGILCFNSAQMSPNRFIPPIYLTSLFVNNNPVEFKNKNRLKLKADETNISIGYTAPDFIAPKQNQYAYKMDGVENEWNYVGQRRMAYYNNLTPGTYNFKVKVANSDGIWNQTVADLQITVMPPFYKTWWAYILYFTLITTIVWKFIYYQKVRHELESNIRFKQLEQDKMKELHEERMRLFTNFSHELRHFLWMTPIA